MNGDRQMLPVHTIRIRAGSPIIEIRSAHTRELGDIGSWHGLDCPWPIPCLPSQLRTTLRFLAQLSAGTVRAELSCLPGRC